MAEVIADPRIMSLSCDCSFVGWMFVGFASCLLHGLFAVTCSLLIIIIIIKLHRSTTYVDAAYSYRPSIVVCRSVTLVSPAKMAAPIELPFGLRTWVSK